MINDEWINDFVGVPYVVNGRDHSGWDCWGLVLAVFQERHGLTLPDWRVDTLPGNVIDPASSARQVTEAVAAGEKMSSEILFPETWAIAVVRRQALAHHVGVVVCSGQRILHCSEKTRGTVCESVARFLREYPKTSFWRMNDLAYAVPA